LFGLWQYDDETTILISEEDLKRLPHNSLVISPEKWKIIKLCGRPIGFEETGNRLSRSNKFGVDVKRVIILYIELIRTLLTRHCELNESC